MTANDGGRIVDRNTISLQEIAQFVSIVVIDLVNLIANTWTRRGLRIEADLNTNKYPTDVKVSAKQMAELNLQRAGFQGKD